MLNKDRRFLTTALASPLGICTGSLLGFCLLAVGCIEDGPLVPALLPNDGFDGQMISDIDGESSQDMLIQTDAPPAPAMDMGGTLDAGPTPARDMAIVSDAVPNPDPDMAAVEDAAPVGPEPDAATLEDAAPPEPDPPVNLLENPDFEDGDAPWSIWGGAQRIEGDAQSGEWAVRATERNGAEQQVEGLEPNTTYLLSGWGRVEGNNPVLIGVKEHGHSQQAIRFDDPVYAEGELSFTTGLGNTSAIIFIYKHGGGGAGHADNLSLTHEGPSPWEPVWSDEFDGEGRPDAEKWVFEEGFLRNEELQWYQSENAFLEDGSLVIEGRREQRPNPNYVAGSDSWKTNREHIEYTSSSATTRGLFSFRYGHLVVRAKVSNLQGTWPAIWTLGVRCEWPSNGEIDVMENYRGDLLANFAWGTNQRWNAQWDASRWPVADFDDGWTERFHIWELDWSPESMAIRLDGVELNSVDLANTINGDANCEGENPFQQPHYVLLNLALGGNGGPVDNLVFPTRYIVDYVRVYERQ